MNAKSKRGVAVVLLVFYGILLLIALSSDGPDAHVSILFVGVTNSFPKPVATLRFRNDGKAAVRLNSHATLYWKDRSGVATNAFFRHELGYAILQPEEFAQIAVSSPSDTDVWQTSFTYSVRPNWLRRNYERIRFWIPGRWTPDNSFVGRFGPVITNSTATAAVDGVFLNTSLR